MAEENQETTSKVAEQQVKTNNPKKVKAGKRLAEYNHKKREELKEQKSEEQKSDVSQYYSSGAVIALGVIGGLGYCLYQAKKGEVNDVAPQQPRPQTNKFEML